MTNRVRRQNISIHTLLLTRAQTSLTLRSQWLTMTPMQGQTPAQQMIFQLKRQLRYTALSINREFEGNSSSFVRFYVVKLINRIRSGDLKVDEAKPLPDSTSSSSQVSWVWGPLFRILASWRKKKKKIFFLLPLQRQWVVSHTPKPNWLFDDSQGTRKWGGSHVHALHCGTRTCIMCSPRSHSSAPLMKGE